MVKFYRKLWRSCTGYHGISLPGEVVAHLNLEFGGMCSLELRDGEVVIRPVKECA